MLYMYIFKSKGNEPRAKVYLGRMDPLPCQTIYCIDVIILSCRALILCMYNRFTSVYCYFPYYFMTIVNVLVISVV